MKSGRDKLQREILPIPDRPYTGFITYDAKDPEAKFPPIDPLLPPEGAPMTTLGGCATRRPCSSPSGGRP
jgi:hypothetical protein